jgi:hypothetical protein
MNYLWRRFKLSIFWQHLLDDSKTVLVNQNMSNNISIFFCKFYFWKFHFFQFKSWLNFLKIKNDFYKIFTTSDRYIIFHFSLNWEKIFEIFSVYEICMISFLIDFFLWFVSSILELWLQLIYNNIWFNSVHKFKTKPYSKNVYFINLQCNPDLLHFIIIQ